MFILAFFSLLALSGCAEAASLLEQLMGGGLSSSSTPTMSPANLTAAVESWPGYDVAVFYYSPYGDYGKYSSQVLPLWDEVARWHKAKKTKRLVVIKFSCESSSAHRTHCFDVAMVRQYPTITYYGYSRLSMRRGALGRATNYRGMALSEALRDWTVTMSWLSSFSLLGDRILQLLRFKPSPEKIELELLRDREMRRKRDLERRLDDARTELNKAAEKTSATTDTSSSAYWESLLADLAAMDADFEKAASSPNTKGASAAAKSSSDQHNKQQQQQATSTA